MIRGFLEAIIIVTMLVSMFMGDKDFGIKHYESYEPLCIESKVTDIKDSLYRADSRYRKDRCGRQCTQ